MASFKDIYEQDKNTKAAIKPEDVKVEKVEPVKVSENIKAEEPVEVKREMTVLEEQVVRVDITESITEVLSEQREQTAKVLESVMKSNTKIANNVAKHVKSSQEVNEKLVEAIVGLTEKIELLEAKLEAIENLEIPTPIVQVQSPRTRIKKEVHRDGKGLITHVTESEEPVDDDGDE
jgi:SNF2 family DNA or RNA helicase